MQWMKAGDVVRAMKDMLKTCEEQKRGDLKVHKDGIHFADERGQPAGPREPLPLCYNGGCDAAHCAGSVTGPLEDLQSKYHVHGFPINDTITGSLPFRCASPPTPRADVCCRALRSPTKGRVDGSWDR